MKSKTPITDSCEWEPASEICKVVRSGVARELETKLNELDSAARHYWHNSIPSAEHMAEWQKLKDALAAMPNVES